MTNPPAQPINICNIYGPREAERVNNKCEDVEVGFGAHISQMPALETSDLNQDATDHRRTRAAVTFDSCRIRSRGAAAAAAAAATVT
jgi:hypothetical protein